MRRQSIHSFSINQGSPNLNNYSPSHGATGGTSNPSAGPSSPVTKELHRRESLVKPTWQNVCPGQVSPKTLERVNGIDNGLEDPPHGGGGASAAGTTCNESNTRQLSRKPSRSSSNEIYDIFGKVMLLGDSGVGKTCLLVRFRDGTFLSGNFISTVGIDFRNKVVNVDNTRVKLQIWDTAGQERFRSVTHAYYRDAHALLLLYDVTNKVSFDNIRAWLVEIREYAQEDVVIMLLGNKADCGSDRQVKREEGERLAREYNVAFMETSAKTGLNVGLAFLAVARQLKCRRNESLDEAKFNVQDFVREQTQPKQTCPQCNM
ncbi:ras-related protein Rab-37 isoform X2 [Episyrphus balteatus]|uniref:ras-related protein Rab-37 isoform X2 n=1 Tax=Episyrphus balteatus TaxID=286459 RepID=UPI002484FBE4|nr:ras-related protein Rab-37 isoform X2 [Episyrphus balteatus]